MMINQLPDLFKIDLERLKTLKIGVIPAKYYYRDVFIGWFLIYLVFVTIQLAGCFLALSLGTWEGRNNHTIDDSEVESIEFSLSMKPNWFVNSAEVEAWEREKEKLEQKLEKAKKRLKRQEEYYKDMDKTKMVLGAIFGPFIFFLFFFGQIRSYVIFKHQFKPYLQTGSYLNRKIKQAFLLYFIVFAFICIPLTIMMDQDMTFFAGMGAFIIAAIISILLIDMEASRIGVSILATTIRSMFNKKAEVPKSV